MTDDELFNMAMNYEDVEGQSFLCKNGTRPDCCSNRRFCAVGTFQSVFNVMRDSVRSPHPLDLFWTSSLFNGSATSEIFKFPNYVVKSLNGIPIPLKSNIRIEKLFLNLQPFIPLCRLYNLWENNYPQWGIKFDERFSVRDARFCTLFKPGFFHQMREKNLWA